MSITFNSFDNAANLNITYPGLAIVPVSKSFIKLMKLCQLIDSSNLGNQLFILSFSARVFIAPAVTNQYHAAY